MEDIPLLVDAILDELGVELEVSPAGLQRLAEHPWPGNIRELRHALQRAALLSDGDRIEVEQLLLPERSVSGARGGGGWPWGDAILPLEEVERRYLRWCLQRVPGDRRALAERLGVSERTLLRDMLPGLLPAVFFGAVWMFVIRRMAEKQGFGGLMSVST